MKPITGDEIRSLRERAHLSQAVFARYLNQSEAFTVDADDDRVVKDLIVKLSRKGRMII